VVELSGSGTIIKVSPTSLDFGKQKVGTKSAPRVVTATNNGSAAVTYNSISIGGTNKDAFSEINNCSGRSIPPGGSCEMKVMFHPAKTGAQSAALYINPNNTVSPVGDSVRDGRLDLKLVKERHLFVGLVRSVDTFTRREPLETGHVLLNGLLPGLLLGKLSG